MLILRFSFQQLIANVIFGCAAAAAAPAAGVVVVLFILRRDGAKI